MLYEKLDIRKQYLPSDFTIRAPRDPSERKGVTRRTGKKGAPLQLGIREAKINRSYTYHRMHKTRVPKKLTHCYAYLSGFLYYYYYVLWLIKIHRAEMSIVRLAQVTH